jgi:hypothetical protein
MRLLSTIAVAAFVISLLDCWAASAGPCQKSLSPDPIAERDGYKERDGGQRCEGIYTSPVAGESVQIVSLSQGRLSYDFGQSAPLLISLAITPANPAPVHVRAVGIPERLYYEMDADTADGRALVWPITSLRQTLAFMHSKSEVAATQCYCRSAYPPPAGPGLARSRWSSFFGLAP